MEMSGIARAGWLNPGSADGSRRETRANFRLHVCWPHMSLKLTFASSRPPHVSLPFSSLVPFRPSYPLRLPTDHGTSPRIAIRNFSPRSKAFAAVETIIYRVAFDIRPCGNKCITLARVVEGKDYIGCSKRTLVSSLSYSIVNIK